VLKKLILWVTLLYTLALTAMCLVRLKDVPNLGVSFGDKLFHFLAYGLLTCLWFGTFFFNTRLKKSKAIGYALIFSMIFGIIIEVLQGTATDYRAFDVYDVLANGFGALLTAVALWLSEKLQVKNQ